MIYKVISESSAKMAIFTTKWPEVTIAKQNFLGGIELWGPIDPRNTLESEILMGGGCTAHPTGD